MPAWSQNLRIRFFKGRARWPEGPERHFPRGLPLRLTIITFFDFGFNRLVPTKSYPLIHSPITNSNWFSILALVLDPGIDDVTERPSLDAIIGRTGDMGRTIRHAGTDETVAIVTATGKALALNWLASRIHAADVRT
jgi:hypothetical protein